jgi:translation elongation factor EF-Tu-like GTPase
VPGRGVACTADFIAEQARRVFAFAFAFSGRYYAAHGLSNRCFASNTMAGFAEVLIELLPTENGGRRIPLYLSANGPTHYRPHFRVRGGNGEMLGVEFIDGPGESVLPGGNTWATVRFIYEPEVCYDELVLGAEFEILEGDRVVGVGRVTRR